LGVHAAEVAAVLDGDTGELRFFGMEMDVGRGAGFRVALPGPVRAGSEAGPTGYGPARELFRRRPECVVAAPSEVLRGSGSGSTPIVRDAGLPVRLRLAGKLRAVRVSGDPEEALRQGSNALPASVLQAAVAARDPGSMKGRRGPSGTIAGWIGWCSSGPRIVMISRSRARAAGRACGTRM
jgi:hypothetical protein